MKTWTTKDRFEGLLKKAVKPRKVSARPRKKKTNSAILRRAKSQPKKK